MRKRTTVSAAILAVCLLLTGCGTQLFELTDEERSLITTYSAYVVSLHNTYQKDGLLSTTMLVEDEEDDIVIPPETEKKQEETQAASENSGGSQENPDQQQQEKKPSISLAEAIGHGKDLSITYKGCSVADSYVQGEGYSLTAQDGRTFIIAEFRIKNTSKKTVKLDNLTLSPSFRCHYNDSENAVGAEMTFLDTDLGSFEGSIAAGKSANAVLLFEVPAEKNLKISSFTLSVFVGGEESDIEL